MRIILILSLVFPAFLNAQINRSATEFAQEKIGEYIENKLFKDQPYKPVSFGELKPSAGSGREIAWSIEHSFEITQTQLVSNKRTTVQKLYRFAFYLDKKMKIYKAESFSM